MSTKPAHTAKADGCDNIPAAHRSSRRGLLQFADAAAAPVREHAKPKSASEADLPGSVDRELAEAEAAIATAKQTYYDALNRRHRALRALARETNQ